MTAPQLLSWITAALLLQLTAGVAWTLWRRSRTPAVIGPLAPVRRHRRARFFSTGAWLTITLLGGLVGMASRLKRHPD